MRREKLENFVRGWIIGDFNPSIFKTDQFEVAIISHRKNEIIPVHYHNDVEEFNVLISGKMIVNEQELSNGDIFILEKKEIVNVKVLEDSQVLCIKVPSIPEDKICIK
jgi:quercetin dioxygenase-like cupin family protein